MKNYHFFERKRLCVTTLRFVFFIILFVFVFVTDNFVSFQFSHNIRIFEEKQNDKHRFSIFQTIFSRLKIPWNIFESNIWIHLGKCVDMSIAWGLQTILMLFAFLNWWKCKRYRLYLPSFCGAYFSSAESHEKYDWHNKM